MDYLKLSKEVSYALRHAPWEYELELDEEGFVPIEQLLSSLNETGHYERPLTADDLREMIKAGEKVRHEIVGDKIRALYGHSVPMHIQKQEATPPDFLYHGTTHKALSKILESGLKPMSRQYVHLSVDVEIATTVGKRRDDEPVILIVDAKKAHEDGVKFYIGNDKVWLADQVGPQYLKIVDKP